MSRQLITFEIGDRCLGIDIMAIREIRAWSPATPLPNVPAYVRGVVNLRGVVLPVLDLSLGSAGARPSPARATSSSSCGSASSSRASSSTR